MYLRTRNEKRMGSANFSMSVWVCVRLLSLVGLWSVVYGVPEWTAVGQEEDVSITKKKKKFTNRTSSCDSRGRLPRKHTFTDQKTPHGCCVLCVLFNIVDISVLFNIVDLWFLLLPSWWRWTLHTSIKSFLLIWDLLIHCLSYLIDVT